MSIQSTLTDILNTVAFLKDEDGNEISILAKAKEDLNKFLDDHTSISDDEKAKRIYDFFTNTITSVTVQAIAVAGQTPLQDAQIQTMQDETAQKIESMKIDDTNKTNESIQKVISMQNEDKARLNDSAVNVAKAKAEIETLLPVQVQEITKNIELRAQEIINEAKKVDLMDKDIAIKDAQRELEVQRLPLLVAQTENESKRVDLMASDILLKDKQIEIEGARIPLINAQTLSETKRLDIMDKDIGIKDAQINSETKRLDIMDKDLLLKDEQISNEKVRTSLLETDQLLKLEEIPLRQSQTKNEDARLGLTRQQIRVSATDVQYKLAQLKAIEKAGILNKEIEEAKNKTQIQIAEIYKA